MTYVTRGAHSAYDVGVRARAGVWGSLAAAVAGAVALGACGDDAAPSGADAGAADTGTGGGDAGLDAGPSWPGPAAPEPPRMTCPTGWRSIVDDEGVPVGCDPWPVGGRATCTAIDEAHFPGEVGCARIGPACPAGDFPEGLPAGATVVYVRAGSTGGDGTLAAPFATITDGIGAAPDGAIVAVAKGDYAEVAMIRRSVTLWGACVAETSIRAPGGLFSVFSTGPIVVVQNFSVLGGGAIYNGEGNLTLRAVSSSDANPNAVSLLEGTTTLEDVIVRRTMEAGIQIGGRASVTLRRVVISEPGWSFVTQLHGTLTASDVAGDGSRLAGAYAMTQLGGAAVIERLAIEGPSPWLVTADAMLELRDALIRPGAGGATREIDALQAFGNARVAIERARIEEPTGIGLLVAESADVTVRDASISRPLAVPPGFGRGIGVEMGGHLVLERVRIDEATELGALVTDGASHLQLDDVVIRRTRSDASGFWGRAVHAQLGATVGGERVRLDENREVALFAAQPGTRITLADLDVNRTLERGCATTSCPGLGGGIGVTAILGGAITLTRALIRHNALVGIQVARDGAVDLSVGEVSDNPVGANVQIDGYDFMRLSDRVAYLRNGTNLDTRSLPVPDETPPVP